MATVWLMQVTKKSNVQVVDMHLRVTVNAILEDILWKGDL